MGGVQNIDVITFSDSEKVEHIKCTSVLRFNKEHFKYAWGIKSLLIRDDAIDGLRYRLKEKAKKTKVVI